MAVSGSAEFDVSVTPEQVMDAIADVETLPQRSSQHKSAAVESRHDDGRPKRVVATVSAAGLTDTEITEYTWNGVESVSWELVESAFQSQQSATYTLTPTDSGTHVRFDLTIAVKAPLPGLVVKRILKGAIDTGSKGFKKYVESR